MADWSQSELADLGRMLRAYIEGVGSKKAPHPGSRLRDMRREVRQSSRTTLAVLPCVPATGAAARGPRGHAAAAAAAKISSALIAEHDANPATAFTRSAGTFPASAGTPPLGEESAAVSDRRSIISGPSRATAPRARQRNSEAVFGL
jgi:hypothetical protein